MSVTGSILAGVGLAGGIGSAVIGSNAAQNAASTQANASNEAAQLQYQLGEQGLGFQEQQYAQNQANQQPFLQSGYGALSNLDYLLGVTPQNLSGYTGPASVPSLGGSAASPILGTSPQTGSSISNSGVKASPLSIRATGGPITPPGYAGAPPNGNAGRPVPLSGGSGTAASGTAGTIPVKGSPVSPTPSPNPTLAGGFGSLLSAYPGGTFQSPTLAQAEQAPGYQFQLQQGEQALQQSAAARGNLLTGGTAKALDTYGQGLAQTDYNNVYNQALQNYNTNYNVWSNNQANQFNRLASMAGVGQTTANQLGSAGQSSANSIAGILGNVGSQVGSDYQNAAAANASGYVGSANAWSGALNSGTNNLSQLLLLNSLYGGGGGGEASLPGGYGTWGYMG